MEPKGIKLRVAEALQDDAYRGIARIDFEIMKELGIRRGDIIAIKGAKETVAIADKAYPADVGEGIIRVDGIIRKNAKTGVGETIIINKADVREAKRVIIAPAQKGIRVQGDIKPGLLGRAVVKGDILVLGGVQRRRELMNDEFGIDDIFNDLFGGMNALGGMQQIRFVIAGTNPNNPCVITENTEVILSNKAVEVSEETIPEVTYEDIGGLTDEVKKIREMVELPLKHPEVFERLGVEPPKGVLLYGPPGTGKTLLAKAVANESDANFILLNGPEVMSKFYGESEKKIRDIFEEAEKNAPSIIFIDEIDSIAPQREDVGGEVERRVVSQLLTMMDGLQNRGKVIVIAATNRVNSIDPALRRPGRFDRELELRAPDKHGRLQILKIHTRGMPLTKDVELEYFAGVTHGFVGADLSALTKEAAMVVLRRLLPKWGDLKENEEIPEAVLKELKVKKSDFDEALKVVRPSAMREILVETPNIGWTDVGGLDKVKMELKEAVEWPLKYPEAFTRLGIRPPKGILLYGPPGTGKTLLAKAVAKESEANFIQIKGPSLLSMWVGKSEEGVRKIFGRARQVSPCIIFFDEIDALAGKRGFDSGSKVTERVLNQILAEMDGIEDLSNVIVIGATNRPDMLDSALLRPGRFDRILLVGVPEKAGREQILSVHTKNMPISPTQEEIKNLENRYNNISVEILSSKLASDEPINNSDVKKTLDKKKRVRFEELSAREKLLHYLAEVTEGYTGADIESFVREAALLALRENLQSKEVKMKHFEDALKKVGLSVTKADMDRYRRIETEYLRSAKAALETPTAGAYLG
ncbi:CDC48 family AAA ATPase [Candidatus Pacearchaeota archaeon]|nr:CDC48 family AAA ATPase [Candidatus Pacearchaeota archaeon]